MSASSDAASLRRVLLAQFDMAWALAWHHIEGLTEAEYDWRPSHPCLHIAVMEPGHAVAEQPTRETYDIGAPSPAWLLWHMDFWWSNAEATQAGRSAADWTAHAGAGDLTRARDGLVRHAASWRAWIQGLSDEELLRPSASSWPLANACPADIAAWLNIELTKNGAEIGLLRFLFETRTTAE